MQVQPHLSSLRLNFRQGDVWAKANQTRKDILPMRHSVLDTESPTSLEGFKLILPIINPFNYAIPGRSPEWQKKKERKSVTPVEFSAGRCVSECEPSP